MSGPLQKRNHGSGAAYRTGMDIPVRAGRPGACGAGTQAAQRRRFRPCDAAAAERPLPGSREIAEAGRQAVFVRVMAGGVLARGRLAEWEVRTLTEDELIESHQKIRDGGIKVQAGVASAVSCSDPRDTRGFRLPAHD